MTLPQPTAPLPASGLPSLSKSLQYRPDIDGLRAIAVLGVVFYHAGLGFPGGYVGVDVFFVISGFLITSLLLRDLRNGTFSLLDFWERRARRILPALFVVVLAILGAGWFLLLPLNYEALGKQVIALIALSSNIQFWRESGYFDSAAEEKPLLHTWSLSVEEQFYLLFPLLLALLFKWRKSAWIVPVLAIGALASFGLAVYGSYQAPEATFYLLPTRAWELAAGALLAYAAPIASQRLRHLAAWLGLAAIILPYFLYFPGIRFPGLTALPPVAGAALLIWSGLRSSETERITPPGRLLASRPLVWIGLLSYSLYLWHWPFFAFQKYQNFRHDSWIIQLSLVLLSITLAAFSLYFIERPFRSRKIIRSRNTVFGLSAVAIIVMLIPSLRLQKTHGAKRRMSPEIQRIAAGAIDKSFRNELKTKDVPDRLVHFGVPNGDPKVFVWGDSHAMSILAAVDAVCRENGVSGKAATHSSTVPVLDWFKMTKWGLNQESPAFNAAVFDYIEKNARAKGLSHVILAGCWEGYIIDPSDQDAFLKALSNTVKKLTDVGCKVILVREVPQFTFDPPKSLVLAMLRKSSAADLATTKSSHQERTRNQQKVFKEIESLGVRFVDPVDSLADTSGVIRPFDAGGVFYWNFNHLNTYGSMRLKPTFQTALFPTIKSEADAVPLKR